jgi:hypothetical protein
VSIELIPVRENSQFPEDESQFPYMYSVAYLRLLCRQLPAKAWWARSKEGTLLPLVVKKRKVFRTGQLLNHPFCPSNSLSVDDELRFLNELVVELVRQGICDRLIQPTTNCVFQTAPTGAVACPFGSYRLPLYGRTEDEIFSKFHADYRNKIRAAIRQGAEVRFGKDQLSVVQRLHAETMAHSGMGADSLESLTALFDVLAPQDRILCAAVYFQDQPLGGIIVPYTQHSAHYTHGGSGGDVQPAGAVRLLHWEVIRKLLHLGVGYYDFVGARLTSVEGTKLEHIQRFKSRFGCELAQGVLWKADVRPWNARLYDLAIRVRRALPGGTAAGNGDIIDQELRKLNSPSASVESAQ